MQDLGKRELAVFQLHAVRLQLRKELEAKGRRLQLHPIGRQPAVELLDESYSAIHDFIWSKVWKPRAPSSRTVRFRSLTG